MSHWSNSASQVIGINSGNAVSINFNTAIVPGNNPVAQAGNYTYAYNLDIVNDPNSVLTRVTAVLTVNNVPVTESRSFTEIDTGEKASLARYGELQQLEINDEVGVRIHVDDEDVSAKTVVETSPNRCTLTLRRVTGQGT